MSHSLFSFLRRWASGIFLGIPRAEALVYPLRVVASMTALLQALRQKLDFMPSPGDGPEYHANLAFWKDGVRKLLSQIEDEVNCA